MRKGLILVTTQVGAKVKPPLLWVQQSEPMALALNWV